MSTNALLSPSIITKETLVILENNLVAAGKVNRQFENQFVKIGNSLTIRNNAARQAWGYNAGANLDTFAAQNYQTAGDMALFGSLINTGANVADKWQSYSQAGVDPFAVGAF